jgi:polyhydroxyalkanoate synthesis regulator phasin
MAAPANEILRALEELVAELPARIRGSRERVGEGTVGTLRGFARELGLVTRDDVDELELRVAQLEHRLRLLERDAETPPLR